MTTPETTTETITKTIILPLQTSTRKTNRVTTVINEWQTIASRMADLMPSIDEHHWRSKDTTLNHVTKNEFPDNSLRTHDARQAAFKVGEAYASWKANHHSQDRPTFGDGNYARFCHCGLTIESNNKGYGAKINLEPYNPEWFHINPNPYHSEYLDAITNGDARNGSFEIHHHEPDDSLTLHLAFARDIPVYKTNTLDRVVGIDLGERAIYAGAVLNQDGGVESAIVESGREFRHYRDRLKEKRAELMERDDLRGVKQCRDEHQRYTDHITHVVSRELIEFAKEHEPCTIVLEDLTGYRDTATEAIHDWPFAEIQTKIAYKAHEVGLPVVFVDPRGTSYTCSECGSAVPENRHGLEFNCRRCGYEVHADVNAAKNIAGRFIDDG